MKSIVAVQKDGNGVIKQYKLDDGTVLGVDECIQAVKANQISNCNVGKTKDGHEAVRSDRDGDPTNNLDNLPTF